jgi:hypothetical protein
MTIAANNNSSLGYVTLDPGTWFLDATFSIFDVTGMTTCSIYISSDQNLTNIYTANKNIYNSFTTTNIQLRLYYVVKLETPQNIYYGGSSNSIIKVSSDSRRTHLFAIKLLPMDQKTNFTDLMTLTTNQSLTIGTINNITSGNLLLILSCANLNTASSVSMSSITNSFVLSNATIIASYITNMYNNSTIPNNSSFSNNYLRIETINDTSLSNTISVNFSSGTLKASPDPKLTYTMIVTIPYISIQQTSTILLSVTPSSITDFSNGNRRSFGQLTLDIGKYILLSSARFSCTNSSNTNFSQIKTMGIMIVPNSSCTGTIAQFINYCDFKMTTTDSQDIFLCQVYEITNPNQIMYTCLQIHTNAATINLSTNPNYTYFKAIKIA